MASIQQVTQQHPVTEDDAAFGASADLINDLLDSCLCHEQRKSALSIYIIHPKPVFGENEQTKQTEPDSVCYHFTVWLIGFDPGRDRTVAMPGNAGRGSRRAELQRHLLSTDPAHPGSRGSCRR